MSIPIISVVGKSGSGKTTLLEKLIPELKRRGLRVATIKHHSHPGFEMDKPGKDTWRHTQAGSDMVILAAPDKIASIQRIDHELGLDEIASWVKDCNIILTEGFKRAGKPSLEVVRAITGLELLCDKEQLFAIATDTPLDIDVHKFDLQDADGIVDLIIERFISPDGPLENIERLPKNQGDN